MATHKPKKKYMRRFGLLPDTAREAKFKAKTEYGKRLEEKQKLKFIYGIGEKQFLRYVKSARKSKTGRGEAVLRQLETRLDNVVYRLGFAKTREQARQLASHGHFRIGGRKVNIPSYEVKPGDRLVLDEKIFKSPAVQEILKERRPENIPSWLERKENSGIVKNIPPAEDLPKDADMRLVLEFYRG